MERLQEFTQGGRKFVYIDFSGFTNDDDIMRFVESAKPKIRRYPEKSLYTITNFEGLKLGKGTNDIITKWAEHNKPYVKFGAVYGLDPVKKTIATAVSVITRRTNLQYVNSKDEAIAWLLKQS